MKIGFDLKTIVILLLIGFVVFQQCTKPNEDKKNIIYIDGKPMTILKHKIDTIRIVKTKIVEKKGKDIYHDTTIYVNIPSGPIDTMSILKDFYSKKRYIDTLDLGKNIGNVIVSDTISKNSIFHRRYDLTVSENYIKDMMIVKENERTQVYAGPFVGFDKTNFINSVGGGIMLKTKKDKIYNLNLGLLNQQDLGAQPFIGGGVFWKIKLKK